MFSDSIIRNLKPAEKRYTKMEEGSYGNGTLGIRVSPNGNKAFILRYFFRQKDKLKTIGQYPKLSLSEAREKAAIFAKQLNDNIDPLKTPERAIECIKVKDLCQNFYENWSVPFKKSHKQDARIIRKYVNPVIGHLDLTDLKRFHIKQLLADMHETPIMANLTLALIRKMFNYAIEEEFVEFSPAYKIREPYKKNVKDRVLTDKEINIFWNCFTNVNERPRLDKSTALALRMCLLTGQRQGEITGMKWSQIEGDFYLLERMGAKNSLPHRIPLSFLAKEIIEEAKEFKCSEYIFPSFRLKKNRGKKMNISTLSAACSRQLKFTEIPKFTPHDLRRTATTMLASMRVNKEIISALLNHKESGITSIYLRYSYDDEKLEAVNKLSHKIRETI